MPHHAVLVTFLVPRFARLKDSETLLRFASVSKPSYLVLEKPSNSVLILELGTRFYYSNFQIVGFIPENWRKHGQFLIFMCSGFFRKNAK